MKSDVASLTLSTSMHRFQDILKAVTARVIADSNRTPASPSLFFKEHVSSASSSSSKQTNVKWPRHLQVLERVVNVESTSFAVFGRNRLPNRFPSSILFEIPAVSPRFELLCDPGFGKVVNRVPEDGFEVEFSYRGYGPGGVWMSLAILVIPLVSRSRRSASISYEAGSKKNTTDKNSRDHAISMISSNMNVAQLAGR